MIGNQPCQTIIEHYFNVDLQLKRHDPLRDGFTLKTGSYLSLVDSMVSFDYLAKFQGLHKVINIDAKDIRDFNPSNWDTPEREIDDWFIFDETAVRKMLNGGKNCFFLVNDYRTNRLVIWTSQAIGLGKRRWARRGLDGYQYKWKLLYNITSSSFWSHSIDHAFNFMVEWVNHKAVELAQRIDKTYCIGKDYIVAEYPRGNRYRKYDLSAQGGA
jgi:hypothetical protein